MHVGFPACKDNLFGSRGLFLMSMCGGVWQCPRCGGAMPCRLADLNECMDWEPYLSSLTVEFLQTTQWGWLCRDCLRHFDTLIQHAALQHLPSSPSEFKEGVHYYIEDGRWVLTELYHILKGRCCRNGCRHCVYGWKVHSLKNQGA